MSRKKSTSIRYFLAETAILILGISISFLLNEWRLNRQARHEQVELLKDFQKNLKTDSVTVASIAKNLEAQMKASDYLLKLPADAVFSDSVAYNLLVTLNYAPFTPTQITYEEMKSLGTSNLIENDTLARGIIRLYEVIYKGVLEWTDIDGAHIKERLIPYTSDNFPFARNLNYSALDQGSKQRFMAELRKDKFLYIMQYLLIYKASTKVVYDNTFNALTELLSSIESELKLLD